MLTLLYLTLLFRCLTVGFKQPTKSSQVQAYDTKADYDYENLKYRINVRPNVSFEERWSYAKTAKQ